MSEQGGLRIGVDVGGTKIAAGIVDGDGVIHRSARRSTPDAPDIPAAIAELVAEVADGETVAGVGIGAAGFISADRLTVLTAPNIDWNDATLGQDVARLLDVPVVVENDANAAAWGEYRFGAGRGTHHMLAVTVGTGVGGGLVVGGQLVRGAHGIAAEVGHVRFERNGLLCGCGLHGCLEQYASGTALVRRAQGRLTSADGGPVSGPEITRLVIAGDPEACDLLAEFGRDLGEGIATLVAVLDPEVVVIGGGVAEAGDLLLDPVREGLAASITGGTDRPGPRVVAAELGNEAGLVGASDLAGIPVGRPSDVHA
ncbi:ROK family protein [Aeromicrobium sp. Leaf350]|uniref:ROK family protein n=1 Tax=Aeromicrobium sp. Leaf350 TaxID=2876565 RepID=UPI001E333FD6|nr:ROK family protein [Aeromicrobium sp. Leaf350]